MESQKNRPNQEPPKIASIKINIVYFIVSLLLIYALNSYFGLGTEKIKTIPYSEFLDQLENGKIKSVVISEEHLTGETLEADGKTISHFFTVPAKESILSEKLNKAHVPFTVEVRNPFWSNLFSWLFPLLIFYFIWSYMGRRLGGMSTGVLSMTKSKAKAFVETEIKTRFVDVAGIDEAKEELLEVVHFLQDPKRYSRLGGRAPKGLLLVGPPGTGKTLLARAVAGEAQVPFFSINGSEFVEMFVGLGAARVRDLFDQAKKSAPCILFIDEIDALGKSRAFSVMGGGANDEKEQTLNQLLAEMDGFDSSEGVIMLAATNRPEVLDPALLRAGRFDRQVVLSNPDQQGRLQILRVHAKKVKLDPQVDLGEVASMTPGFSGADLANLVNEATLVATRRNADSVLVSDFVEAIERIVAGLQKKTKLMSPLEKKRVAFHELGHATVALGLGGQDKVQKISIIPRGFSALGYTLQRPLEDRYLLDRKEIFNRITVLLGGRASEALYFEEVSTGASDDLAKASDIARSMVMQFGMGQSLGLVSYDLRTAPLLQSQLDPTTRRSMSEATEREMELEIKSILDHSFENAKEILQKHKSFLDAAVVVLMEKETLDEQQIAELWAKD